MKNVIKEYASSAVALFATILFFLVTGTLLLGEDSILAEMIANMGGYGIQ